jgi:hypothetical protein
MLHDGEQARPAKIPLDAPDTSSTIPCLSRVDCHAKPRGDRDFDEGCEAHDASHSVPQGRWLGIALLVLDKLIRLFSDQKAYMRALTSASSMRRNRSCCN